jgi:uncharacterized LabA/DUF88 family protein
METPNAILLIDGENLVFRYQEMVAAGRTPRRNIVHIPDVLVWHGEMTSLNAYGYRRVCYYTSVVGDDNAVASVKAEIAKIIFYCQPGPVMRFFGQLVPKVFKKSAKSRKTRNVDIQIIIDVMRIAHGPSHEQIVIASGDGDYLPLFEEVMHSGKQLYVGAFSSGLNPAIPYSVDEFIDLDQVFFEPLPPLNDL